MVPVCNFWMPFGANLFIYFTLIHGFLLQCTVQAKFATYFFNVHFLNTILKVLKEAADIPGSSAFERINLL